MKYLSAFLAVILVVVSGCALLGDVTDKVAGAIDKYCDEPLAERLLIRDAINAELAADEHSVLVTCAGDPVATP